jgi:hypothetical protein
VSAAGPRRWTTVYVQFSLPVDDQAALDAALLRRGTSIGLEFRDALRACLEESGIDPERLELPPDEAGRGHDHGHGR